LVGACMGQVEGGREQAVGGKVRGWVGVGRRVEEEEREQQRAVGGRELGLVQLE
jgi:hypothetical protein